jgi:hypothetical protein
MFSSRLRLHTCQAQQAVAGVEFEATMLNLGRRFWDRQLSLLCASQVWLGSRGWRVDAEVFGSVVVKGPA